MKTKTNTKRKTLSFFLKILAGGILGFIFGYGVCGGFTANNKLVSSIETTLQKNCDCEIVKSDISAVGIQFSMENGLSNSQAGFILENCRFSTSAEREASRLNELMQNDIKNYHSIDLITFQFKSENDMETVSFKDGCLLETNAIY